MKTLEIIWLTVGAALTTATQLRPESLPVGPGEVMLSAWLLLVGVRLLIRTDNLITSITRATFWFWIVSFISLALGFLIAESSGIASDDADMYHDAMAFAFSFLFSMAFSMVTTAKACLQKLLLTLFSFITLSLIVMLLFPNLLPFINPWYGGIRFSGWANNPNQLALLVSMVPFCCLHLINCSNNKVTKVWYVLLITVSVVVGVLIQSDALIFAWVLGFFGIITLIPYQVSKNREADFSGVTNLLVTLSFLVFIYLVFGQIFSEELNSVFSKVYDNSSQGSERLILWKNGIFAVLHSPLFGLGPGPHSGEAGPLLNFEAHNTFIDWAGSSGIVGVISYVALLSWVGWNAWQNRAVVLVAAIISLAGFSCFHYVLRHVIFWFYLLAIANLSTQTLKKVGRRQETGDRRQETGGIPFDSSV